LRWLLDPSHGYTVREAYRFLTNNGNHVARTVVDDVWHKHIPTKVSLFVWRLLRNRLPTKYNLVRRRIIQVQEAACAAGCGEIESVNRLFLNCDTFSSFGLICCNGWVCLRFFQVTFDIISLSLRI